MPLEDSQQEGCVGRVQMSSSTVASQALDGCICTPAELRFCTVQLSIAPFQAAIKPGCSYALPLVGIDARRQPRPSFR